MSQFLDCGNRGINLDHLILWEDVTTPDPAEGEGPYLLLVLTGTWGTREMQYPTQVKLYGEVRTKVLAMLRDLL